MNVHSKMNCLIPPQSTHSKMKTNIRSWMYILKGTVWYPFCLDWSSISCFINEIISDKEPIRISGKITTLPRLFSEHSLRDENIELSMYTLKGTVWYPFCPLWSSISCSGNEIVSDMEPIRVSCKITTLPRLFSEHSLQDENKHQIMNVYTEKKQIPILSSLVKY